MEGLNPAPVLSDLAALCAPGSPVPGAGGGLVSQRLERRYLRIRFVQRELGKLDFSNAPPDAVFGDLVFEQTDFSVYRNIPAASFGLFSGPGLDDYGPDFFEKNFGLSKKAAAGIISGAYTQAPGQEGPVFRLREERFLHNPLFLSLMRTLNSSLDFAPLFSREELFAEYTALGREAAAPGFDRFLYTLILALHGGGMIHSDGMRTGFSVEDPGDLAAVLRGTFRPDGKAHTLILFRAPGIQHSAV